MTWVEWFRRGLSPYPTPWGYLLDSAQYMLPVFGAIRTLRPPPASVVEVGCGIGTAAAILSAYGYQVTGIDSDERVLALGKTMPWAQADLGRCVHGLATAPGVRGDIATSLGLIEHEPVQVRLEMLGSIRRIAPLQVVVWPSPRGLEVAAANVSMGEQPLELEAVTVECWEAGWHVIDGFGFGGNAEMAGPWSYCVIGRDDAQAADSQCAGEANREGAGGADGAGEGRPEEDSGGIE